ncbi:MAG: DUF72 domain-containing protein [Candidatus Hydrothermarchaeota archaeon]|nr:DUF72 domain-containing protein [Candidatus Hydrothermarchaeota archaeon]
MKIKVGCCGFPGGMQRYFQDFEVVETQSTFYDLPKPETAQRWRERAPQNFEFSVKAWQLITHPATSPTYKKAGVTTARDKEKNYGFFKATGEVFFAWNETLQICDILEAKVALFQCPASFGATQENITNMRNFFNSIKRKNLKFAWEPRGKWKSATIKSLCKELDIVHCVDPFVSNTAHESDAAYFRLHGSQGKKMYYYKYTQRDLEFLLKKCKETKAKEVYCLFNNISMWEDALAFKKMLNSKIFRS